MRQKVPAIVAWAVAAMGLINILSSFVSLHHEGLLRLEAWLPLAVVHGNRNLTLLLGFALLMLAYGLARSKRQAWRLTLVALAASALVHLLKRAGLPEAIIAASLLGLLLGWRRSFTARPDPPSMRQGYRALALLAIVLPIYSLTGYFVFQAQFAFPFSVVDTLHETAARLTFANLSTFQPLTHRAGWFLGSIPLVGWSGVLYALVLLLRGAVAPWPTTLDRERARQIARLHGRNSTSYMTLWPGNTFFFGPQGRSYICYRVVAGVALALGDPVGPAELLAPILHTFIAFCQERGWDLAVYGASPASLETYRRLGLGELKIGEEAEISLPGLSLRGKHWQGVRTALNRAAREGIDFHLYEGGSLPPDVRAQIFEISRAWLDDKRLPEMSFTLGDVDDIDDPSVLVSVAQDCEGRVLAFADWLPIYARAGWAIDLMRRRPDAPNGVMEFMIGSALLALKERGHQMASLGAVPLANLNRDVDESLVQQILGVVYRRFDTFYHFQSLFGFKQKFQPEWRGTFLVYQRDSQLPRIGLAVLRAHLPGLTPGTIMELLGATAAERLLRVAKHGRDRTASGSDQGPAERSVGAC
jgi:phosphatidylglycerol lysyltransferase